MDSINSKFLPQPPICPSVPLWPFKQIQAGHLLLQAPLSLFLMIESCTHGVVLFVVWKRKMAIQRHAMACSGMYM